MPEHTLARHRLALGVAALLGAAAAQAQTTTLEEIVVTTQKRQQSLQDVPVAVTAFSQDMIDRLNVQDFGELFLYTPGFSSSPNYSYHIYSSIRGISSTDFGFGADPSIGFYVNGVHLGRYGTQVVSYYDLERIEVVKGPQNTLFGRSSIAGAISVATAPAGREQEAYVDVGAGNHGRYSFEGMVNTPLSPTLAFRAAAYLLNRDGYIENPAGGDDIGRSEIRAARASLRYDGDGPVAADLVLSYEDRQETGNVYSQAAFGDEFIAESTLSGDENRSDFEVADATLTLGIDLADRWSLTSISGFRDVTADYAEDYDGLAQVVGGPYYQGQEVSLFNQELRLQFLGEGGVAFMAGVSYFDEDMEAFVDEWVDTTFAFFGTTNFAAMAPRDYSNAFLERGLYGAKARGWAGYADVSWPLTDRFELTAGLRYNHDEKQLTLAIPDPAVLAENASAPFPCACYLYGAWTSTPLRLKDDWSDTSGRLAARYDLTDQASIYLSWSQGWKAGGIESFKFAVPAGFPLYFGLDIAAAGGSLRAYDPEESTSIELGIKGSALDQRLRYEFAVYDFDYTDLQKSVFQGATAVILNVGEAKGRGIEGDLRLRPADGWDLFLNFAYNETEITDDPDPAQEGRPLNRAPQWSGALGLSYGFAVGSGRVTLGATHAYQDAYRTDESAVLGVEAYRLTNIDVTYAQGRWQASLYVDNAFDEFTYNRRLAVQPFVFPVETRSVLGSPRQFGASVRYRFGN